MSNSVNKLTPESFNEEVQSVAADTLVLVDFYADWCNPCMQLAPRFASLAEKLAGKNVKFCKYDIEQDRSIALAANVRNLPTVVFFKNGEEVNRFVGTDDAALEASINEYLA